MGLKRRNCFGSFFFQSTYPIWTTNLTLSKLSISSMKYRTPIKSTTTHTPTTPHTPPPSRHTTTIPTIMSRYIKIHPTTPKTHPPKKILPITPRADWKGLHPCWSSMPKHSKCKNRSRTKNISTRTPLDWRTNSAPPAKTEPNKRWLPLPKRKSC